MSFGKKLQALREERNISIRELAEASSLSLAHLQYLERNTKMPGDPTLVKLAEGLGVSTTDLRDI